MASPKQICIRCMLIKKKYEANNVTLLYPKTEQVHTEDIEFREIYDDGVTVRIRFLDLFDIQSSLDVLCTELNSHPEI